jgi:hypothetical protein
VIPVCDNCTSPIESNNHRHPGYCSPPCRESAAAAREARRQQRLRELARAREEADAARQGRFANV